MESVAKLDSPYPFYFICSSYIWALVDFTAHWNNVQLCKENNECVCGFILSDRRAAASCVCVYARGVGGGGGGV